MLTNLSLNVKVLLVWLDFIELLYIAVTATNLHGFQREALPAIRGMELQISLSDNTTTDKMMTA